MNSPWSRILHRYRRIASVWLARRAVRLSGQSPIISFTFDDFPISAIELGGRILEQRGVRGTYYASLGLMDQDSPVGRIFSAAHLAETAARGHELGCHTFDHCDAATTDRTEFENSILRNRHVLRTLLPGARFKTLSYPKSEPRPAIKNCSGRHFVACRAGGQTLQAGAADLNGLSAFFIERSVRKPEQIWDLIAKTVAEKGWLILATHDVCENPSRFGCTPGFFEEVLERAVKSGAQILPVGSALERLLGGQPGT